MNLLKSNIMKTTYDSVAITAHVIGAKSRKAMYLVQPQSMDGNTIYKNAWIPTSWNSKKLGHQVVQWENTRESYVELPISQVTPSMLVETISTHGVGDTLLKSRLVEGKPTQYVALQRRYIIYVPTWAMQNLEKKFTKVTDTTQIELFANEPSHYSIIDDIAHNSQQEHELQDRPDNSWFVNDGEQHISSEEQWLIDNPEYRNDLSIL